MDLKEFIEVNDLLSIYKELLKEKQREYLEDYFENDFSLSEIAKKNEVSRQAVYDNIKKTIKILNSFEEKLGILKKQNILLSRLEELKSEIEDKTKIDKIIEECF